MYGLKVAAGPYIASTDDSGHPSPTYSGTPREDLYSDQIKRPHKDFSIPMSKINDIHDDEARIFEDATNPD